MKDITQPYQNKINRKLKMEDIIGLIFGISLVWTIGLNGFVPYIVGIIFGILVAGKMLNSKKQYVKIIFWILLVTVFLLGSLFRGMQINKKYQNLDGNTSSTLPSLCNLQLKTMFDV